MPIVHLHLKIHVTTGVGKAPSTVCMALPLHASCIHQETLQGQHGAELREYWQTELAGYTPLQLSKLCPHRMEQGREVKPFRRGSAHMFSIEQDLHASLVILCRRMSVSLETALLAALHVLLHCYSGQEDIAVGCVCPGRTASRFADVLGCFTNVLMVRVDVSPSVTLEEVSAPRLSLRVRFPPLCWASRS